MLNRAVGVLLAVGLALAFGAHTALAQENVRVGRFSHFYGDAKVKEVGATGTYVQLQDTWLNQGVYKGDEVVTGEDSKVEIMIESTKIELLDRTHVVMDKSDEGLYLVNMVRGSVTAHIDTDVFQLRALNQTVFGKGKAVVNVRVEPNNDIIIKAISGASFVFNEYGATIIIPEMQVVRIKYDRLRREYIFRPAAGNTTDLGVRPKGARKEIEIQADKEYVVSEDGTGELRKMAEDRAGGEEGPRPKPERERTFSVDALVRYDWFETDRDIYWYIGEKETFKTTRASLCVSTKYRFAEVFLGVDAVQDNPLEDLWLRLFIPEHEKLLGLKVGQMRVPFGAQVRLYPQELLLLEYSSAVKYAFASTQGDPASSDLDYLFDAGIQIHGSFEVFAGMNLEYNGGFFNGEKRVTAETNENKASIGRLGLNFSDSFMLGGSSYEGEIGSGAGSFSRRRNGIDFKINAEQFVLLGEYIWAEDNPKGGDKKYNVTEGYCVEIGFGLGLLKENWDKWMLVSKMDILDPPKGLVNPGSLHQHVKTTAYAFGITWRMSDEVRFTAVFETLDQGKERYLDPIDKSDVDQRAIFQFNISF